MLKKTACTTAQPCRSTGAPPSGNYIPAGAAAFIPAAKIGAGNTEPMGVPNPQHFAYSFV